MDTRLPYLVTLSGQDGPGLAKRLFAALEAGHIDVRDVEQVRVHGRLLLCVEIGVDTPGDVDVTERAIARHFATSNVARLDRAAGRSRSGVGARSNFW